MVSNVTLTSLATAALSLHEKAVSPLITPPLQRQSKLIAYEFLLLLQRGGAGGTEGDQGLPRLNLISRRVQEYFLEKLHMGTGEAEIAGEGRLVEKTLLEIRSVRDVQNHFFHRKLHRSLKKLARLAPNSARFGESIFREVHLYRARRDEEEARFLTPLKDYRPELIAIIGEARQGSSFTYFKVETRMKQGVLAKLGDRGWDDMEKFYDLLGLRIVVGNMREVEAALALVRGAFGVHESAALLDKKAPHFFRIQMIREVISRNGPNPPPDETEGEVRRSFNRRGYRARHLGIRRYSNRDRSETPVAEIQIMSRGIRDWGTIQRDLVYKGEGRIPEGVMTMINDYCRAAADYITLLEDGGAPGEMPEPDIVMLHEIGDKPLQSSLFDRLVAMEDLMIRYRNASFDRLPRHRVKPRNKI